MVGCATLSNTTVPAVGSGERPMLCEMFNVAELEYTGAPIPLSKSARYKAPSRFAAPRPT